MTIYLYAYCIYIIRIFFEYFDCFVGREYCWNEQTAKSIIMHTWCQYFIIFLNNNCWNQVAIAVVSIYFNNIFKYYFILIIGAKMLSNSFYIKRRGIFLYWRIFSINDIEITFFNIKYSFLKHLFLNILQNLFIKS